MEAAEVQAPDSTWLLLYAVKTTSTTSTSTTTTTCSCGESSVLEVNGQQLPDESETNISFNVTVPECCCIGKTNVVFNIFFTQFCCQPPFPPAIPVLSTPSGTTVDLTQVESSATPTKKRIRASEQDVFSQEVKANGDWVVTFTYDNELRGEAYDATLEFKVDGRTPADFRPCSGT